MDPQYQIEGFPPLVRVFGDSVKWPYTLQQLRVDEPQISISLLPNEAELSALASLDSPILVYVPKPVPPPVAPSDYNDDLERVEETHPVLEGGTWIQSWKVVPLTAEEKKAIFLQKHPPRWELFGLALLGDSKQLEEMNIIIERDPKLFLGMGLGLLRAAENKAFVFLKTWEKARRAGLVSDGFTETMQTLGKRCNLPESFIEALAQPLSTETGENE